MSDSPIGLPFHPEGSESPDPEPAAGAAGGSRGGGIPTVEECLLQLKQLNISDSQITDAGAKGDGPTGGCGDGKIQPGELCDDGNSKSGDGCAACHG